MSTPQLPEEVKRAIDYIIDRHVATPKPNRQWLAAHLCDHVAAALTPYLTPRPPAPVDAKTVLKGETFSDSSQGNAMRKKFEESVDAEWAKRANEAIAGIDYAMDWKNNSPSAVEFATGLAAARQFIIDARHAPDHSAQLAAMREERDAAQREIAELRNAGGPPFIRSEAIRNCREEIATLRAQLAAAQSEVGRLTKERDEAVDWKSQLYIRLNERRHIFFGDQSGIYVPESELATLRRERDELAKLLETECNTLQVELAGAKRKFQDGFDCVPFCELSSAANSLLSRIKAKLQPGAGEGQP